MKCKEYGNNRHYHCIQTGEDYKCSSFGYCEGQVKNKTSIAPKKPRMVRVKAWAYMVEGKYWSAGHFKSHHTEVPCHILIERKYLGRKG